MTVQLKQDTAGVVTIVAGASGTPTLTCPTSSGTLATTADIPAGLTGFTSSQDTSSPNDTRNASRLLVVASSTHADFVGQPKGSGAFLAQLPDGTSTGGNKRGISSVDLQLTRGSAARVASGPQSVVGGGFNNKSSAYYATVAGGKSNIAGGVKAAIGGGDGNYGYGSCAVVSGGIGNSSSGDNTFIGGGSSNNSTAYHASVMGGFQNTADGVNSWIGGGARATTRGIYGAFAAASGTFGTLGDCQRTGYVLRCRTTDATTTVLTADQAAAGTANQVILPNNSSYAFRGILNAHRTDVIGTSASYQISGCIRRGANAASTTLVGTVTRSSLGVDSGASTWNFAITADTTNGGLKIEFTGEAAKTIRSGALIEVMEVTS
jgi:hypothetical protein